ncbi:MAG: TonB-dependent siderophore receptor [Cyanobacteria bacterium P01_B01_bin.77]
MFIEGDFFKTPASLTALLAIYCLIGQPARATVPQAASLNKLDSLTAKDNSKRAQPNNYQTNRNLLAQGDIVEITDIQIDQTATGLMLRLKTSGQLSIEATSTTDNTVVTELANAILTLPEGEDFVIEEPTEGISLLAVTNLSDNRVQMAITGTNAPPVVDILAAANGLIVTAAPGDATAQISENDALRIVVTGEQTSYLATDTSTATRTDTPLRDVPQSIQIIPRQVIEDQQATSIEEVLENAAGVIYQGDDEGRGDEFSIRGFAFVPVLRDGFLLPGFSGDAAGAEVANLERVEVLRGPASVLYGESQPGGVINLVTKRPLSEPYYNLQLQGGNREFISPSIDLSGPLTDDGRLLYRLNALYRQEQGFHDYDNNFERFFIAPTLTWLISDSTDLTVNLEYTEDNEPQDVGIPAFGDGIADVPLNRVFNDPGVTREQDYLNVGYALEHRFSENWQLRNQFRYTSSSYEQSLSPGPVFLDESTGVADRFFGAQTNETETYSLYTNVQGKFDTGPIQHTVLFGVDLARFESDGLTRFDFFNPAPLDIFDPDYSAVPFPSEESIPIFFDDFTRTDQLGIYLQDQIDILDNLILVAGLRYNTVDTEFTDSGLFPSESEQFDDALTPRIGIVYQPIEPISLYGNYSRSFVPITDSTDANGNPFDPEEGEGFEVGIRGEIIENRLAATLAYFNITKQNVVTADPINPFASVATGEQRSQGIDFDLTGEILPGWNIVASYAYIDAEVTEDNTDIVGNRLFGVPEHSASLWTTYEIQAGDLQGLGFGLGFNFVGEQQGDLDNSFQTDSYFLTNAAVFYRQNDWQVQLNIDNLFDINYIESVNNRRFNIYPGDPLTVRASVSYTF